MPGAPHLRRRSLSRTSQRRGAPASGRLLKRCPRCLPSPTLTLARAWLLSADCLWTQQRPLLFRGFFIETYDGHLRTSGNVLRGAQVMKSRRACGPGVPLLISRWLSCPQRRLTAVSSTLALVCVIVLPLLQHLGQKI